MLLAEINSSGSHAMKAIIACFGLALAACCVSHPAGAQPYQPTYISPLPNGGYIVNNPPGASPPYQPTYINPLPNGGYIVNNPPGASPPYQPTYINPLPNGGAVITQPGARTYGRGESGSEDDGDSN
jgi:hypothetical protein